MARRFYSLVLLLLCAAVSAPRTPAAVIFRSNEKTDFVVPGEEKVSGNAQQLFEAGQDAEAKGHSGTAAKTYRAIVRRYPKDALAPAAAYRVARVQELSGDYLKAADSYRLLVEKYPSSPHFDEAIEAQFRIGEMYLAGKKIKLLGIPLKSSLNSAIDIFGAIVRTAPYGRYTARAQFDIGLANEKQDNAESAVAAYNAVAEKFPDNPIAADALYQIGYLWMNSARNGVRDAKAVKNARIAFQDFLFRYPKSEKAAQARENLRLLQEKQTTDSFQIAKFYDKQKNYGAAVIYYNDVIREQPGSTEAGHAKQRVDQIRAKVGDAVLQSPALTAATAKPPAAKPMPPMEHQGRGGNGAPPPSSQGEAAPLPPPDYDESLPPPASLAPGTTTAPDPAATPDATPEP